MSVVRGGRTTPITGNRNAIQLKCALSQVTASIIELEEARDNLTRSIATLLCRSDELRASIREVQLKVESR